MQFNIKFLCFYKYQYDKDIVKLMIRLRLVEPSNIVFPFNFQACTASMATSETARDASCVSVCLLPKSALPSCAICTAPGDLIKMTQVRMI